MIRDQIDKEEYFDYKKWEEEYYKKPLPKLCSEMAMWISVLSMLISLFSVVLTLLIFASN